MAEELTAWPGLREEIRSVREALDSELGYLHNDLFDPHVVAARKTLKEFASRVSQTVAKVDRDVARLRAEVDERLQSLEEREEVLEKRAAGLTRAKEQLEADMGPRPVSFGAVVFVQLSVFLAAVVVVRASLDVTLARAAIIGLIVVSAGAIGAHGAHAIGLDGALMRWGGVFAAVALAGLGTLAVESGAGDAPEWRRGVVVVVAAVAAAATFAAVYGFIITGRERLRRRLVDDAVNGVAAAENELRRVVPIEQRLLKAAQVDLGELASNNCRIALEEFSRRAAQLVAESPTTTQQALGKEYATLTRTLEGKVKIHLADPGQPDAWS